MVLDGALSSAIGLMTGSIEATSIGAATDVAGKIRSDGQ